MGAVDNVKDALKILQASDNIDILKSYIEIEKEYTKLREEILDLKEENKQLKKQFNMSQNLFVEDNAYYYNDNNNIKGPFCTKCWDVDKKLVHMSENDDGFKIYFLCPNCNNRFVKQKHSSEELQKTMENFYK